MRFLSSICPILFFALLLLTSCKKDNEEDYTTRETLDAVLIWRGDPALDGCGFVLRFSNEDHKPINWNEISESYKTQSSTAVEATIINYHTKTWAFCSVSTVDDINKIKVISLSSK